MGSNFWDDDDVKAAAASGQYASFLAVGDSAEGKILKLGKQTFSNRNPDGTVTDRLAFTIMLDSGATITAGQVLLQKGLLELRPEPGEQIKVVLAEIEKRGLKTLKKFRVEVTGKDGKVRVHDDTTPTEAAPAEPEF